MLLIFCEQLVCMTKQFPCSQNNRVWQTERANESHKPKYSPKYLLRSDIWRLFTFSVLINVFIFGHQMSSYIEALFYIDHLEHFKCFLGFFQLSGLCVYKSQLYYSCNINLIVCKVFFNSLAITFIICKFLLKKVPEIFFKGGNIFDPFF